MNMCGKLYGGGGGGVATEVLLSISHLVQASRHFQNAL